MGAGRWPDGNQQKNGKKGKKRLERIVYIDLE